MLAMAIKSGLTVADLYNFSLGFVTDFISSRLIIEKGKKFKDWQSRYKKLKAKANTMKKQFQEGKITAERYNAFLIDLREMEEFYG